VPGFAVCFTLRFDHSKPQANAAQLWIHRWACLLTDATGASIDYPVWEHRRREIETPLRRPGSTAFTTPIAAMPVPDFELFFRPPTNHLQLLPAGPARHGS